MTTTATQSPLAKWLDENYACEEATLWAANYDSLEKAGDACERSDWMIWALRTIGYSDKMIVVKIACWCARETPIDDARKNWDLLKDERSRNAVELAERYANGGAVSLGDLREARDAAAADAATYADAAYAAAATYAADAARMRAKRSQADMLRDVVGNPFKQTKADQT